MVGSTMSAIGKEKAMVAKRVINKDVDLNCVERR
jgi:hypothetical protein